MQSYQYETTYVISGSLEDSQIEATVGHVDELIKRNGGEIVSTNRWGRKRLAYPIEKKNNGYYVHLEFTAPGALIGQLERLYQLDENILRFLTIRLDKRALKAKALAATRTAEREAEGGTGAPAATPAAPGAPAAAAAATEAAPQAATQASGGTPPERKPIFTEAEGD
jgi:small subunit ribosomal protein S6